LLSTGGVLAPGCFDAFSAHLVQRTGFDVVYISGLAVEATQFASPDIGLVTRPEMVAHAARIAEAVDIPIICDADTGFGDGLQIQKTVRQFERAGVAAIHIEDQASPKGCPTYAPAKVLPLEAARARVAAAVQARTDPDFVLIARTDADSVSFDEVISRANEYIAAGADMALMPLMYLDGQKLAERDPAEQYKWWSRLAQEVDGPVAGFAIPPGYRAEDMFEAGIAMIISATVVFQSAATAMLQVLEEFAKSGTPQVFLGTRPLDPRILGYELAKSLGIEEDRQAQLSFPAT
jgi:2-methylisocitrate lyase-like PEP mutase family enzyme